MKKNILLLMLAITSCCFFASAQPNFLDSYIGNTVTLTTIGTSTNQLNQPRDLDFKPHSNELWVVNYGSTNGSDMVIFYNAGQANQSSQYRKDTHTSHFMRLCNSFAFGDDGKFACVSEIQSTGGGNSTFMGPGLWSTDTNIYARVFQNNWVSGLPLGSHLDMLHQSPYAMGIAHDTAMAYWVMDGHNGNICRYDFVQDHGPGYEDHSAGGIKRYIDVTVTRVPQVPSHMIMDKATGWLYFIDGGPKQIKRMDTHSGTITGNLTVPSTATETLNGGYKKVEFATVETLATLTTQPCGIDFYKDRLVVSDYTTGDIYLYNTNGAFTLLQTIQTGHPGMVGVKVGPDGHIWCVNKTESKVYRLDAIAPALDASIVSITSPIVENYKNTFYSPGFNVCIGTITPTVDISNTGTNSITSMEIHYTIDGGIPTVYNWTGMLVTNSTTSVTLPAFSATNGSHQLDVMIMMVNGMADDVDLNNIATGSFRSFDAPVSQPLTEGFATGTFPPQGWNYVHYNPNNKMSRSASGGFGASTGSMKMDNYSGAEDITGQVDYLMTPLIDLSTTTAAAQLKFSVAHARYSTSTSDRFKVLASPDCGSSWTVIYDKAGAALASAPTTTSAFTPTATQWRTDSVSLANYAGSPELLLAFTSVSNYGNNVYVDDIFVGDLFTGISEQLSPLGLVVSPNPTVNQINFQIRSNDAGNAMLQISDITGKQLYYETISLRQGGNKHSLSAQKLNLLPGIYFITIAQDQSVVNQKLIIQ